MESIPLLLHSLVTSVFGRSV